MIKISKEAKIGFATIIAVLLLIWGFNFLKGKNIFKSTYVFYLVYNDLGGLKESNAVLVNGFQVGMVTDLNLGKEDDRKVYVRILVDKEYKIPLGSIAKLSSVDIMGTKAIDMKLSKSDHYHESGDTLKTHIEDNVMDVMEEKVKDITRNVDSLLSKLNAVFNEGFRLHLQGSVENLDQSTGDLADMLDEGGDIQALVTNLDKLILDISLSAGKLPYTMEKIDAISDSLQQANLKTFIQNTSNAIENLNKILAKIEQGEGTTGKLVNNDSLYMNFTAVSKELEMLLNDMRENPKRYVHFSLFGKKDKE